MTSPIASDLISRQDKIISISDKKDRDRQIAKWAVEIIQDFGMTPEPIPTPPYELQKFRALSKEQRNKVDSTLWNREDVRMFFQKESEAISKNKSNVYWLNTWISALRPGEDQLDLIFLRKKLAEFEPKVSVSEGWED